MKPCGTCQETQSSPQIYRVKPQTLDAGVMEFLPKQKQIHHHASFPKFVISNLIPDQTIFYFGTHPRPPHLKILSKDKAYGKLENSGVVRVNAHGKATIHLECPQIYYADDGNIYPRHVHFLYWNNDTWEQTLYTHPLLCIVDLSFVQKWKNKVKLVNALSRDHSSIPDSYSLPHNELWNEKDVKRILRVNKKSIPILVYCYDEKCKAGKRVCDRLQSFGFFNIFLYSKGLKEWMSLHPSS